MILIFGVVRKIRAAKCCYEEVFPVPVVRQYIYQILNLFPVSLGNDRILSESETFRGYFQGNLSILIFYCIFAYSLIPWVNQRKRNISACCIRETDVNGKLISPPVDFAQTFPVTHDHAERNLLLRSRLFFCRDGPFPVDGCGCQAVPEGIILAPHEYALIPLSRWLRLDRYYGTALVFRFIVVVRDVVVRRQAYRERIHNTLACLPAREHGITSGFQKNHRIILDFVVVDRYLRGCGIIQPICNRAVFHRRFQRGIRRTVIKYVMRYMCSALCQF